MVKGNEIVTSALKPIDAGLSSHGSQLKLDNYEAADSREQAVNREIVDWIKSVIVPALVSKFIEENNLTKL